MDILELTPWPFSKQTKDSMKSIEIPLNARVKYYKDLALINNLSKFYQSANIPSEICFDKITSLPVLVIYDPGGTIYFVHTDADFAPIKHALPEPETPRRSAQLLADSSISLDRQYIRNGEPVKIKVYLTKALHSVNIRVYKVNTQGSFHNLSSFPGKLPQGETVGIWDGKVGDDLGIYGVMLEGAEDDGLIFHKTRILKSISTVEVVNDKSLRLGSCQKNGNDLDIYAEKIITETIYQDEAGKELTLKKMIMKAIEQNNQTSSVILDIYDNGPGTSGKIRLMNIEFAFSFRDINSNGILGLTPPTVAELERLRGINTRIDRIITADFIQIYFQEEYKRADLLGREISLGREEFAVFKKFGKIMKSNSPREKLKGKYEDVYSLPATLANYLKLKTSVQEKGFIVAAGNFNDEVSLRVYPKTSRQRVTWINFTDSEAAETPESIAGAIINRQKDQMRIIAPLLTSTAMLKQSGSFTIYLDIPNALITKNPPEISELVEDKIRLYTPTDKNKPFQNRSDTASSEIKVVSFKKLAKNDPGDKIDVNRLFKGTINNKEETRIVRDPSEQDRMTITGVAVPVPVQNPVFTPEEDYQVYLNMYLRKYPGILDECENLYKVELKLNDKLQPGIYLLRVNGTDDEKVHPVMIFEDGKDKYRFSQITDLHLAQRYNDVESYLPADALKNYANPNKSFIEYTKDLNKYDFVVITGDLVEYANDHRPYENDFVRDANWMYVESIIRDNFSVPVFVTPGNHDYRHNTVALGSMTSDLNISKNDAQRYPHDTLQDIVKWGIEKCLEDSLYFDENALQYYFYNFCPFYDYSFQLDNLSFIFLDTKSDRFAFMNDYPTKDMEMTAEYVASILLGSNPAPISTGLLREQLDFVDSCLDNLGILFMHSALINVPSAIPDPLVFPERISRFEDWQHEYLPDKSLDGDVITAIIKKRKDEILLQELARNGLMASKAPEKQQQLINNLNQKIMKNKKILNFFQAIQNGGIYYASSVYLGKDKTTYFDESSVTNFRDELVKRMRSNTADKKRIKLAVVGHVHKNLEFKLKSPPGELEQMRWYCGEYAGRENKNKPLEDASYTIATVSGGYLGYRWVKKTETADIDDIDSYKKEYYGTGYRDFCITSSGVLESMKIIERLKQS